MQERGPAAAQSYEGGAVAEVRAVCWEARMTAELLELAALRKSPIPAPQVERDRRRQ